MRKATVAVKGGVFLKSTAIAQRISSRHLRRHKDRKIKQLKTVRLSQYKPSIYIKI